jgi:CBS domain-containing protein
MQVSDVMTRTTVTIGPDEPLHRAASLMIEHRVSGLPVMADGELVGVLTEADFLRLRTGRSRRWLDSVLRSTGQIDQASLVRDAMSDSPVTIAPDRTVADAARLMLDAEVKRLPVVADDGRLLGIVSRADVLRSYVRSDADIKHEISLALRHFVVDGVEVSVDQGVVELAGTVSLRSGADLAEQLVRRVDGVISVTNDIRWKADEQAE